MGSGEGAGTAICTWFVGDEDADATFFPQIGMLSNAPEAKAVYWRCICCFFASSRAKNPQAAHLLFTNVSLPTVDGLSVSAFLAALGVVVIRLPITYRIRRPDISSWGNQFYILDVIKKIAADPEFDRYVVLDSDCIFTSGIDGVARKIDEVGVLTYDLLADEGRSNGVMNGCSPEGMLKYLSRIETPSVSEVVYCGGEIFAATRAEISRIAGQIDAFWAPIAAGDDIEIREEAHFLSVIYAHNGYAIGTANPFIKRMWTTFKYNNTKEADLLRPIWHLPAEKRTGFRHLFSLVAAANGPDDAALHTTRRYAAIMGVPRRNARKFASDLIHKLWEMAQNFRRRMGKAGRSLRPPTEPSPSSR